MFFYKIKKKIFNMFGFRSKFGADLAAAATASCSFEPFRALSATRASKRVWGGEEGGVLVIQKTPKRTVSFFTATFCAHLLLPNNLQLVLQDIPSLFH